MITTPEIPETSGTQEESVEFDIASMDLSASLAAYLAEPGDRTALIPLSRLSNSSRNILLKVLHRAQGEVTHPDDEFRLEALEEITVQHLKDARNVGSTKANDFLGEFNSLITEMNKLAASTTKVNTPPAPCKKDPVEVIEFSESILNFEYISLDLEKVLFNQKRLGERAREILRSKVEVDDATKRRLKREKSIGVESDYLLWASKQSLVINCAKYYSGKGISFSELIKQGKLGLSMALRKYDHESPHSFSIYATWWIRQAMQIMLEENADNGSVEALETSKAENTNLMGTLISQIVSLLNFASSREINVFALRIGLFDGNPKSLDEIAMIYGTTRERIRQIESKSLSKIHFYLKEIPCPSCGEIITDSSHAGILKRIPAAVELAELISQCNKLSDYLEKLAFEDSDFYITPEGLRYIFRVILQEEFAQKIDSTISSW
jgi:RNA polymerase sigma factor (sigma-70 family)